MASETHAIRGEHPAFLSNDADMNRKIRVLLIDDHPLFREGVSRLLQADPDFGVVRNCGHLREALPLLESEPIDVVLLDYDLDGEYGTLFLEEAKAKGYKGHILMVTAGMPSATILRVLEQGASGIFLKQAPPGELVEAIHKIMSGHIWLDSRVVKPLIDGVNRRDKEKQIQPSLSVRERAVMKAVFKGLSNKQIAAELELSESGVKGALQQLFSKTGVRTRSQLVRLALEHHSDDWLGE
jgi:DNA-binding NarL/FixJ family response regulator